MFCLWTQCVECCSAKLDISQGMAVQFYLTQKEESETYWVTDYIFDCWGYSMTVFLLAWWISGHTEMCDTQYDWVSHTMCLIHYRARHLAPNQKWLSKTCPTLMQRCRNTGQYFPLASVYWSTWNGSVATYFIKLELQPKKRANPSLILWETPASFTTSAHHHSNGCTKTDTH